jgi:hypothetical protein
MVPSSNVLLVSKRVWACYLGSLHNKASSAPLDIANGCGVDMHSKGVWIHKPARANSSFEPLGSIVYNHYSWRCEGLWRRSLANRATSNTSDKVSTIIEPALCTDLRSSDDAVLRGKSIVCGGRRVNAAMQSSILYWAAWYLSTCTDGSHDLQKCRPRPSKLLPFATSITWTSCIGNDTVSDRPKIQRTTRMGMIDNSAAPSVPLSYKEEEDDSAH